MASLAPESWNIMPMSYIRVIVLLCLVILLIIKLNQINLKYNLFNNLINS